MSQENVELVRRAFYPPGAPDLVPLFADRAALAARLDKYLHPDFEMRTTEGSAVDVSVEVAEGARGFVDGYAEWLSAWETFRVTPLEFHDVGDRVLATVRMGGMTKTHGAEVEQESAVIFGIEDGLIRWLKLFTVADDARREAGLRA